MLRSTLRRLLILPFALLLVNFGTFVYARFARWVQASRNPYTTVTQVQTPLFEAYTDYLRAALQSGFGEMPSAKGITILETIQKASAASLGLLGIAFGVSIILGFYLGFLATRNQPPGVRGWLIPITTVGLAMPSFYVGAILIGLSVFSLVLGLTGKKMLIPINGFGWDAHLIFPSIALALYPTLRTAQATAALLSGEFGKQYVVALRSVGHKWSRIRTWLALKNVMAPVILLVATNFRWLVAELILIEMLFNWPGLGRMLAMSLVAPQTATVGRTALANPVFLHPGLVATILTLFALLFLLADLAATSAARWIDPRLQSHSEEVADA